MSRIEDALVEATRARKAKDLPPAVDGGLPTDETPALPVSKPSGKRPFQALFLLSAGASLLLVCGGIYLYQGSSSRPLAHNKPFAALQPFQKGGLLLPAAINQATPDPKYPDSHPGWERFRSDQIEYRVFREKDVVQAVQVIALSEQEISHGLFNSLLVEITGGDAYRVNASEKKGEYLLEKGAQVSGPELLIYRKASNGQIRGFVVSLTKPQ